MENLLVTVIIPVYNAQSFLVRCLQSVLSQSYINTEIIIINDGSTDNSSAIIKNFLSDDRLLYIEQENRGPSASRNVGLNNAKGDLICFVDSDDYISTNYVETLVNEYVTSGKAEMIITDYTEYSPGFPEGLQVAHLKQEGFYTQMTFAPHLLKGTTGVLWGKLFINKIISENKLRFNEAVSFQEDLVFIFNYIQHCQKIKYKNEYTYHYNRMNEGSLTNFIQEQHLTDFTIVQDLLLKLATNSKLKKDIENRAMLFYQQYLYSIAMNLNVIDFRQALTSLNYTSVASQYRGAPLKSVYYKLLKLNYLTIAFYYLKFANSIKNLLK